MNLGLSSALCVESTTQYPFLTNLPPNTAHHTLQAGQCAPQSRLRDILSCLLLHATLLKELFLQLWWQSQKPGWFLLLLLLMVLLAAHAVR